MILWNIKHQEGVGVGGNSINNLRYADGTVLTADSEEKLQNILTTVKIESGKKIECMVISKQPDIHARNILCEGERTQREGTVKFLGFTTTPDQVRNKNKQRNIFV